MRRLALSCVLILLVSSLAHAQTERAMTLGELATELKKTPGALDALLGRAEGFAGVPLSEADRAKLKAIAEGTDPAALDKLPRVSLGELDAAIKAYTSTHPATGPAPEVASGREALGIPTGIVAPEGDPFMKDIGFGMSTGSRLDPAKRSQFGDSKRLAAVLEGLSLGKLTIDYKGEKVTTPAGLVSALRRSGHEVKILDRRRCANFAGLEKDGRPVAAPVWIETGRKVGPDGELVLPAVHAELVLVVSGPDVNASATFFNGADTEGKHEGGVRFRPDVMKSPEWTGMRVEHVYEGADVDKAMRLMQRFRKDAATALDEHKLALDGYWSLGVCVTGPALVEKALTGKVTLWPLVQDPKLFEGTSMERMVAALPNDLAGGVAPDARLLGTVPWTDSSKIFFPEVRSAVEKMASETPGLIQKLPQQQRAQQQQQRAPEQQQQAR